ncbi:MAG: DUF134 domain-containing protein [bacterium]|nr:DUF134 domain-containing protein [bacterium]
MPRPKKCRFVNGVPGAYFFKPRGIPMTDLTEIHLTMDEMEALRLADAEGKGQEEAAPLMGVSRQTFGRILSEARRKVARAIVDGCAIHIEGGVYTMRGGPPWSR